MDEEMPEQKPPNVMRSAAAVMAADILLMVGFVFLLLGIAKFLNMFLGIEGSGEAAVGIALLAIGLLILARSRMKVSFATMPLGRPGMPPEAQRAAPSDSYR